MGIRAWTVALACTCACTSGGAGGTGRTGGTGEARSGAAAQRRETAPAAQGGAPGSAPSAPEPRRPGGLPEPLAAVPFSAVKLADGFFAPRIETNRSATIEACLA